MPPMLAHRDAQRVRIRRHIGARDHQVHFGHLLFALPETHGVPHQIDSRASVFNFIRADHILELHPHFGAGIVQRQPRERGPFFEPPPVPIVRERLPAHDSYRREQPPAADQSGMPRRPPHLIHCLQPFVVKHKSMNHASTCQVIFQSSASRIVLEYPCVPVAPEVRYPKCSHSLRPSMANGASFRPCESRLSKAQQHTEDSWLVGKSNLARVLVRASKPPPTESTSRTNCFKMEQSLLPRMLPQGISLYSSVVLFLPLGACSFMCCWIAPQSTCRFGPASAPGIRLLGSLLR